MKRSPEGGKECAMISRMGKKKSSVVGPSFHTIYYNNAMISPWERLRRRRQRRRILYASALFSFLVGFVFLILPLPLRVLLIANLQHRLGRKVSIQRLFIHPIKGIVARDIRIEGRYTPDTPLLTASEVILKILPLPLIRDQKIVITSLLVKQPQIFLTRTESRTWNVSDVFHPPTGARDRGARFLSVGDIRCTRLILQWLDATVSPPRQLIYGESEFDLRTSAEGRVSFSTEGFLSDDSRIRLSGTYDLRRSQGHIEAFLARLTDPAALASFLPSPLPSWSWNDTRIDQLRLKADLQDTALSIKGTIRGECDIETGEGRKIKASLPSGSFSLERKAQDWTMEAAFVAQRVRLHLPGMGDYRGHLRTNRLRLTLDPEAFRLTGDLTANESLIRLTAGQRLQGDLDIRGLDIRNGDDGVHGRASVTAVKAFLNLDADTRIYAEEWKWNDLRYTRSSPAKETFSARLDMIKADLRRGKAFGAKTAGLTCRMTYIHDGPERRMDVVGETESFRVRKRGAFELEGSRLEVKGTRVGRPLGTTIETQIDPHDLVADSAAGLRLDGDPLLDLTITVPPAAGISEVSGTLTFQDDRLNIRGIPLRLRGPVLFDEESVFTKALHITYNQRPWTLETVLNGRWVHDPAFNLAVRLSGPDTEIDGRGDWDGRVFEIRRFSGRILDSTLKISGRLRRRPSGPPAMNLKAQGTLDLADLRRFPFPLPEPLTRYPLEGRAAFRASFDGAPDAWPSARWDLSTDGNGLTLAGIPVDALALRIRHTEEGVTLVSLSSRHGQGRLTTDVRLDHGGRGTPFTLTGLVKALDLEPILKQTPLKDKRISGILSGKVRLEGPLDDPYRTEGTGRIEIRNGRLGRADLFQGLWKFLLIPEFQDIVFTDASANLTLKRKRIFTDDLVLNSAPLVIRAKGWLALDGDLSLKAVADFRESEILASPSLRRVTTALLAQTGNILGIRITGSIARPIYTKHLVPGRILRKAAGSLMGTLQAVLEELF